MEKVLTSQELFYEAIILYLIPPSPKIMQNLWEFLKKSLKTVCLLHRICLNVPHFFSRIKREHFRFRIFFSSMNEIHGAKKNRTHGIVALVWHYTSSEVWFLDSLLCKSVEVKNTTMVSVRIAPVLIVYLYIFTRFQSSQKSWELVHSKIAT